MRFGQDGGAPFANLRREWSAHNLIGDCYLEMIVALNARNCLVTDLWGKSGTSVNVDVLFGFAA